ncbi:MAG: tetratricopeptide repeat protein [Desulfococcaceae bacterium]
MTEARILIFYFSLIIFPKADRFSLCHDVEISTSLLNPWTTLASTVALAGLIFYAFSPKKNNPLFSFAVLFFFLNHLVESTVIPLELIYEHRNYMPTLFLFLPVSAGISHALDYYQNKNTCIYRLIIILCAAVIGWISMETYKRNGVWISEKSLWENSIQNAPHLARPYHNLAHDHYEKIGDYDKALQLYQKAAGLKSVRMDEHNASFNNIGKIYYIKKEYDKALAYYSKALDINPDDETVLYNLTLVLMETEKWEEALEETDRLLTKSDSSIYRSMKGIVLMRMNRASEAVLYFEQVLKISPDDGRTTFYLGLALSLSGEYEKADAVLNRAKKLSIDKIAVYLYLLENCRKKNDHNCFDRYADAMLLEFSLDEVSEKTDMISHNPLMAPLSQGLAEAIREKAEHQESTLQNPLDETFGL